VTNYGLEIIMQLEFTAVFQEAPEGGYVAFVEELAGALYLMRPHLS
jgi:hypothetical protein